MTSAIDDLRLLLDERGVEHTDGYNAARLAARQAKLRGDAK